MNFKQPMLAVDYAEPQLRFPYFASPKLDGLRCVVVNGEPRTRSMKPIPNEHVRDWFRRHAGILDGLDGELIVGDPTAKDVFAKTTSGIMSQAGAPGFTFFVFDKIDPTGTIPYRDRVPEAASKTWPANAAWLVQWPVSSLPELLAFEETVLDLGYEGAMLRRPNSTYKQGRATVSENALLKVKRFRDAEAIIVGVEEQMLNANPAFRSEIGRTKRSSAQAGKIGKNTLGAIVVKGSHGQPFAGVQFNIGTGMDDRLRAEMWNHRHALLGLRVRYRFLDVGTKDAPRHPVFAGFRQEGT